MGRRPRRRSEVPGEAFARWVVAASGIVVALACMAFSFGNVLALGRHLDVPALVAWCVAPAVDLTVIGLIVGIRHLSNNGATDNDLLKPRLMLTAAGLTMWALNIAYPWLVAGNWGAVAYDSVPPLLLLGWSEIGPWFLRRFRTLTTDPTPPAATPDANPTRPAATDANDQADTAAPVRATRTPRSANDQANTPPADTDDPATTPPANGPRATGTNAGANGSANGDADAVAYARALWEESVRDGAPMSGAALGRAAGRSARWGQKRLAEFHATPPAPAAANSNSNGDGAASAEEVGA